MKCEFTGCKRRPKWACRKLWGKGSTIYTCGTHKPDPAKRLPSLQKLPFFYDVQPIAETQK